ncbi:MAG: dTDP-4-dehydrorhamnose 3,5-epimerase family protein [Candidatus Sungbacteria bacterium]|nr:dTDP-4-dehydrorhamnose 3,5-epimerase family protein [Candidatus Sungbacteria bacterium]
MKVLKTKLKGVLRVELDTFEDHRGTYVETYNESIYRNHGIKMRFVTDDYSRSVKHVLRGFHSDAKAWKFISCLYGRFYLVVVNCDKSSRDFGKWEAFTLSERNRTQILIPPKHGVAHLVLSEETIFHYKQSAYYDPKRQSSFRWDDERFQVWWPVKNPILSRRDEAGHYVK